MPSYVQFSARTLQLLSTIKHVVLSVLFLTLYTFFPSTCPACFCFSIVPSDLLPFFLNLLACTSLSLLCPFFPFHYSYVPCQLYFTTLSLATIQHKFSFAPSNTIIPTSRTLWPLPAHCLWHMFWQLTS